MKTEEKIKEIIEHWFKQEHTNVIAINIIEKYNESFRYFHTLEHIEKLLQLSEKDHKINLIILYHDVVYFPYKFDNEEESAKYFEKDSIYLKDEFNNDELKKYVIEGILQTKNHISNEPDYIKFNSWDMAVLNAPFPELLVWESQISKEYSFCPYETYKEHRLAFLKGYEHIGNIKELIIYLENE